MYRQFLIYVILMFAFIDVRACQHEFLPGTELIDGENIMPGDTVCLLGGSWGGVQLRNIHGTATQPVVVMNKSGVVLIESLINYGIKFNNCSHITLSGSGQPQFHYGIQILSVDQPAGTGISIGNKSTDVEVEFIEIANVSIGGIYAKTEPDYFMDCSFAAVRDSFTMYNTAIHDCYLHDIGNEGMYIGSSKFTGQTIYHCNDTIVMPHVMEGVKIYNNVLENIGWDGIQVSSAVSNCEIYNNTIINNSVAEEEFQMSGILIGGGSNCDCYNNRIIGGKGGGIEYLGLGNSSIFNNLILRSGENYHPGESPLEWQKHGIWVGEVVTDVNAALSIQNNTIISPRSFGIKMVNLNMGSYTIQNNIIASPGAHVVTSDDAYIYSSDPDLIFESNNLFTNNIEEMDFINVADDNYDLQPTSPAVNNGIMLGFNFDLKGRPRPFDEAFDIGAYECQDSSLFAINEVTKDRIQHGIYPNPFKEAAVLEFILKESGGIQVKIYTISGFCIFSEAYADLQAGKNSIRIPAEKLPEGWIIYEIATTSNIYRGKAVKR